MSHFIDRRLNSKKKSAVNRERFLRRYREQIKRSVAHAITGRSITDTESGEEVRIPSRDVSEPVFRHGAGGTRQSVHPGNREFLSGDRIRRPEGAGSGGSPGDAASDQGEGEDEFVFQLSRDEFLDILFDDLELPNLVRDQLLGATEHKTVRAGITTDGVPSNIDVVRSMKTSIARRTALGGSSRARLRELEAELAALSAAPEGDDERRRALGEEIDRLQTRLRRLPYLDTFDLRYRSLVKQPKPVSKAVMFCLMDVSGSMDESRKALAKRFFILLYLFLKRNYERIDVVFIRHHTVAEEVDEDTFFYSRETGGTVVSSALQLAREVIDERYGGGDWNIYGAQASDGDNWETDSPRCGALLIEHLLPRMRYFAYVEITPRQHQSLWRVYEEVRSTCPHFAMEEITGPEGIYPVFRELFRRRDA